MPIASPTRLHLRAERRVRAGELLEREARELDDDVVERRLEARRRRPRQVVRDLVERVADGELRRDLRDRVAGRLRRERRRARDARVHLDHAQLAGLAVACELDVRAAGLDADRADRPRPPRRAAPGRPRPESVICGATVTESPVCTPIGSRFSIEQTIDDVVAPVADDLELELVPAADATPRRAPGRSGSPQAALDLRSQLVRRRDEAAAVAAERERRPHDRRQARPRRARRARVTIRERGTCEPAALHRLAEELAVLGAADHVDGRADQLDAELVEHRPRPRARARG